ncbi:hypothetical protein, partial [Psychrobacter sp. TB20-MNA-CIBAN-0197]|uniref:hypothetical protein n=1 Tax=Psychrobacter sp. TB20-MNA-CIBAN-0197 TaxID=3140453 RepID=UPI00333394EA
MVAESCGTSGQLLLSLICSLNQRLTSFPRRVEVEQNAPILSEPRQSAVPASWNIATFLTTVYW